MSDIVWERVEDMTLVLSLIKVWFALSPSSWNLFPCVQLFFIHSTSSMNPIFSDQSEEENSPSSVQNLNILASKFPHHEARFAMKWHVWWFSTYIVTRSSSMYQTKCVLLLLYIVHNSTLELLCLFGGLSLCAEYWKWQLRDYHFIFNHRHWRVLMMMVLA